MSEMSVVNKCNQALSSLIQLNDDLSQVEIKEIEPTMLAISLYAVTDQLDQLMNTITKVLKVVINHPDKLDIEIQLLHRIVMMNDILRTRIYTIRSQISDKENK